MELVESCGAVRVTPHIAQNHARAGGSALDRTTACDPGNAMSQRVRKRVEELFGSKKTVGALRQNPIADWTVANSTPTWPPPTICSELADSLRPPA
jgi:hypothetical protein